MKAFEFTITLTVNAANKQEAKQIAENTMQNLNEMMGHSPYDCELDLGKNCIEIEYEDE